MATALIPAIFLFYGILSCAYAFVLLLSRPKVQRIAVTYWACGALLTGIATFITVFRNESNLLFTYVGANGIAFMGYISFNYAVHMYSCYGVYIYIYIYIMFYYFHYLF
jgi:hypothetical protein